MTLAWLSAAWIAGTVAAATLGRGAWPVAVAIACAACSVALVRRRPPALLYALALPALFAAGALRYDAARPHLAADAAARFNDGPAMRLRGVLRDDPDVGDTSQRFAITVGEVQVRGEWQRASGGALVRTKLLSAYRSGDVLEIEGKLESPPHVDGFDYADYLARRGIASTVEYPQARLIGHENDSIVRATVLRVRRRLSEALALALPEPQSSLAQGVLLGERSALPPSLADELNATNTSHLVVVSGSNVVLVSAFATMFLAWAVGRRRALLLSVAAVLAYMVLIGASPPVLRATIMGILTVFAMVSGRPASALTTLLFTAALMIAAGPGAVRDVSFQLSFAATAGILYLAAPLRRWSIELAARALRLDEVPRWASTYVAEPLAVTVAAIVATAPLLALQFGRVSLVAVPANLLVVPLFPFILASSLLAAAGGLLPAGRLVFAAPAYYALTWWIEVAHHLAALPHAAADVRGYSSAWAAATYTAIALASLLLLRYARAPAESRLAESRPFDVRRLPAVAAIGMPAVALALTAGIMLRPSAPPRLEVTVLDVGQGDAILVRTPSGQDVLVDAGPGRAVLRGLGEELPWHDRSIELLVLTHPQTDHLLGTLDVLRRYDVRRVAAGPGVQRSAGYDAWLDAVRREGRQVEVIEEGAAYDLGGGVRIDVLGPDGAMASDEQLNNTSAVVRVSFGDVSFLLTGDIEEKAERAMIADGVDLHATVLKVAHHGSKTSTSRAFLEAVRPSYAAISAGRDNAFGHPAEDVVERLREYTDAVYNTADGGAVHFETDGGRVWVSRE